MHSECLFAKSFSRRVSENSDWFSFRSQLIFVPPLAFSVNHLGVLLHGETQVAPTFTVEDILLLVLGPELC